MDTPQKSKQDVIKSHNPNDVGTYGNLFGLPFSTENADLIVIPIPWEVTVSYSIGTANAPDDILYASSQVDLHDSDIKDAWTLGVAMLPISEEWQETSETLRQEAETYIDWLEDGKPIQDDVPYLQELPEVIGEECKKLNNWLKKTALDLINQGKMVAVLGGDHSTPLGLIQAFSEKYENFGILQIDAHCDLRESYEDFEFSHASIMFNALKIPQVSKLVQVGIRDFCEDEANLIKNSNGRVHTFFDQYLKEQVYEGKHWITLCNEIIAQLPENVYISFDIDGLDPKLCPNTGTPVAGGLEFGEFAYLLKKLVKAGKKIIGFDLVEVAPANLEDNEWDANVGARVLYKLCNWMGVSQGKLKLAE
jgi:agmatinase